MALHLQPRKAYIVILVAIFAVLFFTACGTNTTSSASAPATKPAPTQPAKPPTTTTVSTVLKSFTFVGQPTAKMLSGTTFQVDGTVKNGDSKQHDIFIQVTLLDASGTKIATTPLKNVDNIPGGATQTFTIQGTTTQPTWATVNVSIVKVSENIGGSGSD
ncbi:MAG TPA: FxLYD domain-containing protein [Ktedonobacteraceae bacterium]|nr:FxLYD domain-containing protein [Ktedonobacteraceae bacterium]